MVAVINLTCLSFPNFKLSDRAEKVEIRQVYDTKYINYQIGNIFNPKMKFSFNIEEFRGEAIFHTHFDRLKIEKVKILSD
ncbi:unnamed protein product [Meloidogyne enterolobii]|uniref:Uncharacterized protein n=1 Tax=Meloidogyne enterolobii TaxID=390850 RepID=A0ACB0YQH0_MELEN